tara:strand:+ start:7531 stop:8172 length:642 start_codon:yes stop_codon:yes gene_type:complete
MLGIETMEVGLIATKFLGMELIDKVAFMELIFKFFLNFIFLWITVQFIFYRNNKEKDYLFTFYLFNIITFFICVLLRKTEMQLGFAFGLFAVFGIIRYRTDTIPFKEMTYLFIVIGLAMINALSSTKISYAEVLFVNAVIVLTTFGIETIGPYNHKKSKTIVYEKIELIKPEKKEDLLADLRERTGLKVYRATIGHIDFLRDVAEIKIYYTEE